MKRLITAMTMTISAVLGLGAPALADTGTDGLIVKESAHGAAATVDRFVKIAESKGLTIFARIDHAAGAAKVGDSLAPTQLVIFGNPKMGTPLMKANQRIGVDLPLRLIAWTDAAGETFVAYTDPAVLAQRFGLTGHPVFAKMAAALNGLTDAATGE